MEEVKQFLATLKIFDKTCISYPDLLRKRKGTKISFEKNWIVLCMHTFFQVDINAYGYDLYLYVKRIFFVLIHVFNKISRL